jgi:hypothetical protein
MPFLTSIKQLKLLKESTGEIRSFNRKLFLENFEHRMETVLSGLLFLDESTTAYYMRDIA